MNIERITTSDATILIWLEKSLEDEKNLQEMLHEVIQYEHVDTKYLSYPMDLIENGT